MNEIELLDAQLTAEREHVRDVASACATLTARARPGHISFEFIYSYNNYLMFIMKLEAARATTHLELAEGRAAEPAVRAASERLRKALASAIEAAAHLRTTFGTQSGGTSVASGADADAGAGASAGEGAGVDAHIHSRLEGLARLAAQVEDLIDSRVALAALTAPRFTLRERRRTAHVDADSILEERKLHAEAARHGTALIH
jgi:hypothetical protein